MRLKSLLCLYIIGLIVLPLMTYSQVGINTSTPNPSAVLDLTSNTKGLLLPRMTELQRFAIQNPAAGLMIWCLDCGSNGQMQVFNGVSWTDLVGATPAEGPCGFPSVTFTYRNVSVTYKTVVSNGKCWLDRNLGASQVAISSLDALAYGDLFQWGRLDDGHQLRNSALTPTLSPTDIPGHDDFITTTASPNNWRNPQNLFLWQGKLGVNNPCPAGFRAPTETEMNAERLSWSAANSVGAFGSPLKLTQAAQRNTNGSFTGAEGRYWTTSYATDGIRTRRLTFFTNSAVVDDALVGRGSSVRCIKDDSPAGTIQSLVCTGPTNYNTVPTIFVNVAVATGTVVKIPYTGGNGGFHSGQTVQSTTVTGLTAYLYPGQFAVGDDTLTYFITGTPSGAYASGNAMFGINIGGETCTMSVFVCGTSPVYLNLVPGGPPIPSFSHYSVVSAGRCWSDRNIGGSQAASSTSTSGYGHLYQWGRHRAPHASRTSPTFAGPINSDQGQPTEFITVANTPFDWRSPANTTLWQGVTGGNNPCNSGNWRVPTSGEWNTERLSWSSNDAAGAFASPLKLTVAGYRAYGNGGIGFDGTEGFYWASTFTGNNGVDLNITSTSAGIYQIPRGHGMSVRCILH